MMQNFSERANFIWSIAELLRDHFKRGKYQDVILPLTVLRRLDCVLEPTKEKVLEKHAQLSGRLENLDPQLQRASGFAFYNTSRFTFERLLADAPNLAANLRAYIAGFSPNMREVLDKFRFDNTITQLEEAELLFQVMERFRTIDLHPDEVSTEEMGYIFEELIRRFNEALNENPGEHFTPREVIRLMVHLLLAGDEERLKRNHWVLTVYDPCCGSGGMLTVTKEELVHINARIQTHLFGQEVNPETFAVCKSDLYMKSEDGGDAENIKFGSTLSRDQHADKRFDYLITNPPFGKDWKADKQAVEDEARLGDAGRFGAGTPRISDGQMLFLQHLLGRMKPVADGGSRVAIVMNGSPLFTGDAGGGESEIRRWILENDWLDAIVALPEQLFYNTGIATYVWLLSNRKQARRAGKVQLIDGSSYWTPMRMSLGDKRRQISDEQREQIVALYRAFGEAKHSKVFETTHFGYRKITVERPLRLNWQASPKRIERLKHERAFVALAESRKKDAEERAADEATGRALQQQYLDALASMPASVFTSRDEFKGELATALKAFGLKPTAPLRKAILAALSERDENAVPVTDANGNPEPNPDLRDAENVPLGEGIDEYMAREVLPYVPDAWVSTASRDHRDGEVGKVGYETTFRRYFYTYLPPRDLESLEEELGSLSSRLDSAIRSVLR